MDLWQEWLAAPWYAKGMCYLGTLAVTYGIVSTLVAG